jgi:hypothetical protein
MKKLTHIVLFENFNIGVDLGGLKHTLKDKKSETVLKIDGGIMEFFDENGKLLCTFTGIPKKGQTLDQDGNIIGEDTMLREGDSHVNLDETGQIITVKLSHPRMHLYPMGFTFDLLNSEKLNENVQTDPKPELDVDFWKNYKNHIIDLIDLDEYYDDESEIPEGEDKVRKLCELIEEEKGYEIKRVGLRKAIIDYLQGWPNSIQIPAYYHELANFMYVMGVNNAKFMEIDTLENFMWDSAARIIEGYFKERRG